MKQMLIAGNWKMYKNLTEAVELAEIISRWVEANRPKSTIEISPPFPFLHPISKIIEGTMVKLGAQNCHYQPEGAFTGEISPSMLASVGCQYVIIGHSERRTFFKEDDILISKKIHAVVNYSLKPIFCIGETLDERQNNLTYKVLERQIQTGLTNLQKEFIQKIVIAYEPVWAIGTGISATTEQINEAHEFVRNLLVELFNDEGRKILILYGGSLNSKNAKEILSLPNVHGGLIGKASLDASEFIKIIEYAEQSH